MIICLSGEVVKRKKKLSKKYYRTSRMLSKDEARFIFEKGCEQLIPGSGQMGTVILHRMWIEGTEFNWSSKEAGNQPA